jgi:hypothetical protein
MTDLVVSEGYSAVGYEYINVDDCWLEKNRGPRGELVADRRRFPSGMKALSTYVSDQSLLWYLINYFRILIGRCMAKDSSLVFTRIMGELLDFNFICQLLNLFN